MAKKPLLETKTGQAIAKRYIDSLRSVLEYRVSFDHYARPEWALRKFGDEKRTFWNLGDKEAKYGKFSPRVWNPSRGIKLRANPTNDKLDPITEKLLRAGDKVRLAHPGLTIDRPKFWKYHSSDVGDKMIAMLRYELGNASSKVAQAWGVGSSVELVTLNRCVNEINAALSNERTAHSTSAKIRLLEALQTHIMHALDITPAPSQGE